MKGKFEFEQEMEARRSEQKLKDAIAAKELEREKLVRNILFVGFILLMGVAALVYYQRVKVSREKKKSDTLLLNILPAATAEELKTKGSAEAKQFDNVSVLFTDFVNFTGISQQLSPKELVANIHYHFTAFD
ncbi:MAG TPA: adenylate/guanylate cyclase, partial [Bacteroidetes bacterium]|nr:adenylate/guanylate cyclase [Bacteroidota bacterium]